MNSHPNLSGTLGSFETLQMQRDMMRRQKRTSTLSAVAVAVLMHLVVFALALLWVVWKAREEPFSLVVVSESIESLDDVDAPEFTTRSVEKPAAASSAPMVTMVAPAPSQVTLPTIDDFVEEPLELGTGIGDGDGWGMGGIGSGLGGARFLGIKGGGKNIILVIDTSSSMPRNCGPAGIKAIRKEVNRTINALSPTTLFDIVCYANMADGFRKESVRANSANKSAAVRFMAGYFGTGEFLKTRTGSFGDEGKDNEEIAYVPIVPEGLKGLEGTFGGSRIELGVVAAMERRPSTIFVLSDGEPGTRRDGDKLSDEDLVEVIEESYERIYKGKKLTINTIAVDGKGEKFLRKISKRFKGTHKNIKPARL